MNHSDTVVIVTSYCGEPNSERKKHMTKTLCKKLKEQGLFVCLASHSKIDEETQSYCDVFVYDADNSFQINGQPTIDFNHGVAELTSIHNAINSVHRFGFKNMLKLSYDVNPTIDFNSLIERSKSHEKQMVSARWHYSRETIGTISFFSTIEFYKECLPLTELHRFTMAVEDVLYHIIREKGWFNYVELFDNFETYLQNDHIQFCHDGGKRMEEYPYE